MNSAYEEDTTTGRHRLKRSVLNLTALTFVSILISLAGFSQSLRGRVTIADGKTPAPLANVFLSNTSIGTVTNDKGEFVIEHFPAGRYDLVVSFVGYESFVTTIQSGSMPRFLEVSLKPKVNELQEVVVEPYEKDGWTKWGQFFLDNFIGTSANAKDCKLVNKDIVKFRLDKKTNTLKAFAADRLVIENSALGYVLKYDLTRYEYNFNTHIQLFQGYPLFEEMQSKRSGPRQRWLKHRQDAYYGSMMHFMRSLYRNRLIEEHFEVRKLIKKTDAEKQRVKARYQAYLHSGIKSTNGKIEIGAPREELPADTLAYYKQLSQQPESFSILIDRILPGDSLGYFIDSTTAWFNFTNHLQVTYPLKKVPAEYYTYMREKPIDQPQVSELFMLDNRGLIVLANGSYFEPTAVICSGYWGWSERIATMLPNDYKPDRAGL